MTPDEIVNALKLCAGDRCCDGCIEEQSVRHWQIVMRESADLIESLQAQLAALQKEVASLAIESIEREKTLARLEAEVMVWAKAEQEGRLAQAASKGGTQ